MEPAPAELGQLYRCRVCGGTVWVRAGNIPVACGACGHGYSQQFEEVEPISGTQSGPQDWLDWELLARS